MNKYMYFLPYTTFTDIGMNVRYCYYNAVYIGQSILGGIELRVAYGTDSIYSSILYSFSFNL